MQSKRITKAWLTEFLDRALPEVLRKCREADPPMVLDFIRLVEFQEESSPAPVVIRPVTWLDELEELDEAA